MARRLSKPTPDPPAELGEVRGLAYSLWLPEGEPWAGVVVLHGADSDKEAHHDFARTCRAMGAAAIAFDQRGHGASAGPYDRRVLGDVAAVAEKLPAGLPRVLRGSSMGGWLAIAAAELTGAAAVVAICPASSAGLLRGLRVGRFGFEADLPQVEALLAEHDPLDVVETSDTPLLLLHAEGDERVPVAHSRELFEAARTTNKKLVVTPGGHHRSIQHDPELQGVALRWAKRQVERARPAGPGA